MRLIVVLAMVMLGVPGLGWGQTLAEHDLLRTKADRAARMDAHPPLAVPQEEVVAVQHDDPPYQVDIGIYSLYEPTIDPDVTWVWIACFSTPGQSYPGAFSLMYVDVVIGHEGGTWYSGGYTDGDGNDRGICDINKGVDTTFVEIPRTMNVTYWVPTITGPVRESRGVTLGSTTIYPVHVY